MLIVHTPRRTPVLALAIGALVVACAGGAWLATRPDTPAFPPVPPPGAGLPSAGRPLSTAAPGAVAARATQPLAPAPADDPARVFELGLAGGLLVDAGTVTALDRLQALVGDNPSPEDLARLDHQLRQGLPREDAEKAIQLFQGYRAYQTTLRGDVMAMGVPQNRAEADALLARMTAAQNQNFDAASAEAMFGDQNRLSKAVLEAALVQMDPGLSDAGKRQQLDALRAGLPEAQRGAIPDLPAEPASAPQ